jgi:hypothetical protein
MAFMMYSSIAIKNSKLPMIPACAATSLPRTVEFKQRNANAEAKCPHLHVSMTHS